MRYTLRYQQHDFDLDEGEFVVGRAVSCQLSLDDPLVSRAHASFVTTDDGVSLRDLGSRNGVKVNGERVQGARTLEHGDQIAIGSQEMVLLVRREIAADTLVQAPNVERDAFGLMGALADKALALGRGDEAERLIEQQLEQLLDEVEAGRAPSPDNVERGARYALRIAAAMQSARWTDFLFRLYAAQKRPCPAAVVDELYTVLRKVRHPNPNGLRSYLNVLRTQELGPADRFLLNRLEGLERLVAAR
ncbi:MAG: FHA domain-containing protein [Polyangiaceae bacterium]